MLWRRVQEALPRASTSGGQSARCCGTWRVWIGCDVADVVEDVDVDVELFEEDVLDGSGVEVCFLDMAAHAAKEVHERQLPDISFFVSGEGKGVGGGFFF